MGRKKVIVAFMAADGAGKTDHGRGLAALESVKGASFAFATPLKAMAASEGWNGLKDDAGRLILEKISKREKSLHGNNVFAKATLNQCLNYLAAHPEAQFVCIEDLRFGIEARELRIWERASQDHIVVYVYIDDIDAENRYRKDRDACLEYAWSAPELEWRGFCTRIMHIHFENDRSQGLEASIKRMLWYIQAVIEKRSEG